MLHYAAFFAVLAILAGLFGFGIIVSAAVGIAKILFWIFLACFVFSLIFGGIDRRNKR